tara:strand:- start:164 stop:361 length:198 start_codon:yes stop_codon:yes gene_type:complete
VLNSTPFYKTENNMLDSLEILDLLYEDIEELDKQLSIPTNNTDRKVAIQSRINYLFDLIIKIKKH